MWSLAVVLPLLVASSPLPYLSSPLSHLSSTPFLHRGEGRHWNMAKLPFIVSLNQLHSDASTSGTCIVQLVKKLLLKQSQFYAFFAVLF